MNEFVHIEPTQIKGNVFHQIGKEWMLITAGQAERYNTMTASWGGMGCIWNKNTAAALVRPTRYTYEFMEREDCFSLSFFPEEYRAALQLCGRVSGRDTDKVTQAGLTPCFDEAAPYFAQARLVLVCRKLYTQDIDPTRFLDASIHTHYEQHDYHRLYLGEIVQVLQKA